MGRHHEISNNDDIIVSVGGAPYVWVTVRGVLSNAVWPSNRLADGAKVRAVPPDQLAASYAALFPEEELPLTPDTFQTFGNWLARYQDTPERALATTNWAGKVTRALFAALKIKQPRTKDAMISALLEKEGER